MIFKGSLNPKLAIILQFCSIWTLKKNNAQMPKALLSNEILKITLHTKP